MVSHSFINDDGIQMREIHIDSIYGNDILHPLIKVSTKYSEK